MGFTELSCNSFAEQLASKAPVPGGGGAAALVGAVGAALGSMVCNLTTGKKKYADVEDDIQRILKQADSLRLDLLNLVERDAEVFEPLSRAYSISKDDPKRGEIMEQCLKDAANVPLELMSVCCAVIDLHSELANIGSALAISDVGVGVICCKSALMSASLNVFINTKAMADREFAASIENKADMMLTKYCALADKTYSAVLARLR